MKKQFLLINIGLILVSNSFAALPFLPNNLHKNQQLSATQHNPNLSPEGYANFSGNWIGVCDETPDEEFSMMIEQSEDSSFFTVDNQDMHIDTILTQGVEGNFITNKDTVHLRWSRNGQQILGTLINYL